MTEKMTKKHDERWSLVRHGRRKEFWVSDQGRCKSIAHHKDGSHDTKISRGSLCLVHKSLFFEKEAVHRLVAKAFVKNLENLPYVDHLNGDPLDNRAENLVWSSVKVDRSKMEKMKTAGALKRSKSKRRSKILGETVILGTHVSTGKVKMFADGVDAALKLGCTTALVYNCLNHRHGNVRAVGWELERMPRKDAIAKISKDSVARTTQDRPGTSRIVQERGRDLS